MFHTIHQVTRFDYANFSAFGEFDASDTSAGNIVQSAGDVSQWTDKSPDGNNETQGAGAQQPRTEDNTQNGLNKIEFDGIDDALINATVDIPASGDVTFFVAGDIAAGVGSVDALISGDNAGNDFQFVGEAATNFRARLTGPDGSTTASGSDKLGPSVYALVFDFTGAGTYKVQVDGVDMPGAVTYTTKLATSLEMKFGTNRGGGAFLPCSYYESVWIPSAEPAFLSSIRLQARGKWDLT